MRLILRSVQGHHSSDPSQTPTAQRDTTYTGIHDGPITSINQDPLNSRLPTLWADRQVLCPRAYGKDAGHVQ